MKKGDLGTAPPIVYAVFSTTFTIGPVRVQIELYTAFASFAAALAVVTLPAGVLVAFYGYSFVEV